MAKKSILQYHDNMNSTINTNMNYCIEKYAKPLPSLHSEVKVEFFQNREVHINRTDRKKVMIIKVVSDTMLNKIHI